MMKINIFDFDGTLYYNPKNDFTDRIDNQFANFHFEMENALNFLVTGRHVSQKQQIRIALGERGYAFERSMFLELDKQVYQRNDFMELYHQWKIDGIISLIVILREILRDVHLIRIYDDDMKLLKKLIFELENNEIKNISLYHVKLFRYMKSGEIVKTCIKIL